MFPARQPPAVQCTADDLVSASMHEHSILTQATAGAVPQQAPPWFRQELDAAIQQAMVPFIRLMRSEVTSEIRKMLNRECGNGSFLPFSIVPFADGLIPTIDNNLPPLHNVNDVDNLNDQDLVSYLTGYGVQPLPDVAGDPVATDRARKDYLVYMIGGVRR